MRTITLSFPDQDDFNRAQKDPEFKKQMWDAVNAPYKNSSGFVDVSLAHKILRQAGAQLSGSVISPLNESRASRNPDFQTAYVSLKSDVEDVVEAVNNMSSYDARTKTYHGSLSNFFSALSGKFSQGVREAGLDVPTGRNFAEEAPQKQVQDMVAAAVQRALEEKAAAEHDKKAEDIEARMARIEEMLANVALRTGRRPATKK